MTNSTDLNAALTEALKHPGVRTVERVQAALSDHVVLSREEAETMCSAISEALGIIKKTADWVNANSSADYRWPVLTDLRTALAILRRTEGGSDDA